MSEYRLTHDTRETLHFRQAQSEATQTEAAADITAEMGVDRPPLVHIQGREQETTVEGLVTGPRRATQDADTDDWRQALANYLLRLEAHCDEFQGEGYTLEHDPLGDSWPVVFHELSWRLLAGQPYELQFEATLTTGRGALSARPIDVPDVTADEISVPARVDGHDLTGMREMRVQRAFDVDPDPLYNRSSAADNQVLAESGVQHQLQFSGTHTGTASERQAADDTLRDLIGAGVVDFETALPGYTLSGKVIGYESDFQQGFGTGQHHYTLTFLEAIKA